MAGGFHRVPQVHKVAKAAPPDPRRFPSALSDTGGSWRAGGRIGVAGPMPDRAFLISPAERSVSMPGPTTESLAERFHELAGDASALKSDVAVVKSGLDTLGAEVGQLRVDVRGLREEFAAFRSEVRTLVGVVKWVGGIVGASLLILAFSAVWWAGRIDSEVRSVASEVRSLSTEVRGLGSSDTGPRTAEASPAPPEAAAETR